MASNPYNYGAAIPVPNPQALLDCLANGQLPLGTALAQINNFVRETLKVLVEFSEQQAKLHSDSKSKVEKMDKIIYELSEKCQAMQQALLFKEEKFDEKCREVERYKMICEMNAKNAVKPTESLLHYDIDNNIKSIESVDKLEDRKDCMIKLEKTRSQTSHSTAKRHAKLSDTQAHLGQLVEPFKISSQAHAQDVRPTKLSPRGDRELMGQYYPGGPSKRKIPVRSCKSANPYDFNSRVRERLEIMGGVNIRPAHIDGGPVSVSKLVPKSAEAADNEEPNKKMRVDVTGQRNELLSSSGNNAQCLKQNIVEKDLQRQVADCSWNRLSGRRKINWPF